MILKLLKYEIKVVHVKGKYMCMTHTLPSSYLKDPVKDDKELQSVVHSVSKYVLRYIT